MAQEIYEEADRRRKARSEEEVIYERMMARIECCDPECNKLWGVLDVVEEEFRGILALLNQQKDMIRGSEEEVARRGGRRKDG